MVGSKMRTQVKGWRPGHPAKAESFGADCVDWPGIFEHFDRHRRPPPGDVKVLEFISVDPSVDSRHHWIRVLQPVEQGKPLYLRASAIGSGVIEVETRNGFSTSFRRPSTEYSTQ